MLSAIDVVKQHTAFTSVLRKNSNWHKYNENLNRFTRYDAKIAKILMNPSLRLGGEAWMKKIVYFHDKSIQKPKSWDNKYYKAVLVKETENFKFYGVEKVKK